MKKQLSMIQLDTKVKQMGSLDTSDIDGEKVMMDLEKGCYFMLNDVATRIWDMTEETKSVAEIVETLLGEYEIDEETCKQQVVEFVMHLEARELVAVC